MKYNIGDKVIVRSDLIVEENYGGMYFLDTMSPLRGAVVEIEGIVTLKPVYRIKESKLPYWTNEMFVDPKEMKYINIDWRGGIQWIFEWKFYVCPE